MKSTQSVFIATSIDGFIARSDGNIDWLLEHDNRESSNEDYGYSEFIDSVDAIAMGRNSFDKVLSFDKWPYTKKVVVLTHRPLEISDELSDKVETASGTPQEIVSSLAEQNLNHLYVDGGKTIQQFLNAGLIQEMIINQIPVLIGEGIPLFGPVKNDIKLEHITTKTFDGGLVQSRYKVDHSG